MGIDLIRSTIITTSICEARQVLSLILKESTVHLMKNRFSLEYDAKATAGYRDVNLQLTFPELKGSEYEGFIFELQLHIKAMLELKNNEGHKRYITLRNLRG